MYAVAVVVRREQRATSIPSSRQQRAKRRADVLALFIGKGGRAMLFVSIVSDFEYIIVIYSDSNAFVLGLMAVKSAEFTIVLFSVQAFGKLELFSSCCPINI